MGPKLKLYERAYNANTAQSGQDVSVTRLFKHYFFPQSRKRLPEWMERTMGFKQ